MSSISWELSNKYVVSNTYIREKYLNLFLFNKFISVARRKYVEIFSNMQEYWNMFETQKKLSVKFSCIFFCLSDIFLSQHFTSPPLPSFSTLFLFQNPCPSLSVPLIWDLDSANGKNRLRVFKMPSNNLRKKPLIAYRKYSKMSRLAPAGYKSANKGPTYINPTWSEIFKTFMKYL